MGLPVHVISKTIDKSEIEVFRFPNGKRIPREDMGKLKMLKTDMEEMNERNILN